MPIPSSPQTIYAVIFRTKDTVSEKNSVIINNFPAPFANTTNPIVQETALNKTPIIAQDI